jgi:hypothetical protein
MMRMLEAAGIEVLSDGERAADEDNPRGYYELEAVKGLPDDTAWLPAARGKVVKIISQLLLQVPSTERYRVVFMRRDLEEILASQQKMLLRRGEDESAPVEQMKRNFILHLGDLEAFLKSRDDVEALFVSYNRLMNDPASQVTRVAEFVERKDRIEAMRAVIEPGLYRNRR